MPAELDLEALNAAEPERAERALLACCASRRWADELIVHRPYHDLETMEQVSDRVFAELHWLDVEQALAAHPRIGERAEGASSVPPGGGRIENSVPPGGGRIENTEAAWSRAEQAAAGDHALTAELAGANREYEQRFGHVFLICATGLSAQQILDALRERLGNDEQAERAVVRGELRKIANLRLRKLVGR
jgi:2-oxo-4-hydroxy-4-carboxy-5-ureidoimidazoline decarboxylase